MAVSFLAAGPQGIAKRSRTDMFTRYMDDSVVIYSQGQADDDASRRARWLLLVHQIPPKPDYFRVKVRRRLARLGAVALKSTVYVLPWSLESVESFQWLRREIVDEGGEAMLCEARLVEGISDAELQELFRKARASDYGAIESDAAAALARVRRRKLSADERAGIETAVAGLRRRLREVAELDFFRSTSRASAERAIDALADRASSGAAPPKVPRDRGPAPKGAIWVTRCGVFVDRIASAWLIRTFIDASARFRFVSGTAYSPAPGELRFDMFEAEYTHVGDRCTFEVLLAHFRLEHDTALRAIAEIVHDIDVKDGKFGRPEAPGIEQLLSGIVRAAPMDDARLAAGGALFASLYESFAE
jgi:hypothetical protein